MRTVADYDPEIIQKFADRLYARANSIIATWTTLGALVGGVGGYALAAWWVSSQTAYPGGGGTMHLPGLLAGAILGGVVGFMIGQEKAFLLKLQAQTALCQKKIEENTRRDPLPERGSK